MRKICLVVVGLYLHLLSAFSQTIDSTKYKIRKLTLDEANFVQGYYIQNGDHSAVTGGIGPQYLRDYSNTVEVNLTKYNKYKRKIDLGINVSIDVYSSASSDKIDPHTVSSASASDEHFYPSVIRTSTNEQKGTSFNYTGSFSGESDYVSWGFGGGYTKKSKDRNRAFSVNAKAYLDGVRMILPIEFRTMQTGGLYGAPNEHRYPWKPRNTFDALFSLSEVINKRLQVLFVVEPAYQEGYLGLPFHRVYFKDSTEAVEKLPSERVKLPFGIRASYFIGDRFIIRSYYRFYTDDWGLTAHTIDNEVAIKITPFFSVSPFYRYYVQHAINYFAPYRTHVPSDEFFSSDYDLAAFHSSFFGTGIRISPPGGVLHNPRWTMAEIRYGHYTKTDGFNADVISLNLRFK